MATLNGFRVLVVEDSLLVAEVITEPATVQRLAKVIRRKYGVEFIIVTFIERLLARGAKPRVILRIAI